MDEIELEDLALMAVQEMIDTDLPVEAAEYKNGKYVFSFLRDLSGDEQKAARTIAEKTMQDKYTFYSDLPTGV